MYAVVSKNPANEDEEYQSAIAFESEADANEHLASLRNSQPGLSHSVMQFDDDGNLTDGKSDTADEEPEEVPVPRDGSEALNSRTATEESDEFRNSQSASQPRDGGV